jgi:uncharacterized integral membrane protein
MDANGEKKTILKKTGKRNEMNVKKRAWVVKIIIIIIMPLATACPQSWTQLSFLNGEKTLL